jgi:hypothetical protein
VVVHAHVCVLDCVFCYSFIFNRKTKNKSPLEIQVFNEIKFKFILMYSHFLLYVIFLISKLIFFMNEINSNKLIDIKNNIFRD